MYTSINIHAQSSPEDLKPTVIRYEISSTCPEAFTLNIDALRSICIFLSRRQLHELAAFLATESAKYPLSDDPSISAATSA